MATTYTRLNTQAVSVIPGYEALTDSQTYAWDPIYTSPTIITVPYTGGTPTLDSTFEVAVTTGTNQRTLTYTTDYTVAAGSAGEFVVSILADVFAAADVASGYVGLNLIYTVTK